MPETMPEARDYDSILEILEDAARRRPDVVAMALAGDAGLTDEWTATEVLRRSRLAAWRLHALGLASGDRLLIWCPSGPELAALTFGAMRLGVAIVPLDLRMAPEVIERIAGRAETRFLAIGTGRDAPDPREVQLPDVVIRTVPSLVAEPADGRRAAVPVRLASAARQLAAPDRRRRSSRSSSPRARPRHRRAPC